MTDALPLPPRRTRLALFQLPLGVAAVAAAWIVVATATGRQSSWMAVLAALDAAFLLRVGGMAAGWRRAAWAVAGTAATIVLANWGIIASHLGSMLGLTPWESAIRLGSDHAWTLARLANGGGDLAWLLLAALVAMVGSR